MSRHHHYPMATNAVITTTATTPMDMAENDAAALAAEMFDHFSSATTMRQILGLYRNMCDTVGLRAGPLNEFYPKLKSKIKTWKAQALWKKFDARASHRVYNKGMACQGTRVLVIGAGPCGLRTAIEAQLLGAKVVVLEKRDRISRNNVLHLWPFLITDLRNLGAKKFYGKFCAGSIDHISIRQLQCILLKVALLLGVEVHEGVSFERVIEPSDGCGWRALLTPADHAVSHYEFDVLIGADGKRNTLEGFRRKEFRGKLAIAITANFINKKTEAEAKAEEISGVAFIFNQSFFKELYQTTGIDLENIVYYKDETHYFVMTAKKHSLIDKGVIMHDYADPAELLCANNVNTERLLDYAQEAAQFSTKYQMPNLEFAVNHYGKPDVAMFDFTSMFAAEMSCSALVRKNYRLLQCLVGDSLLEPFWPTGSGCARGFLSSMDAAYAIKLWNNQRNSILAVLAQRESIYRLLAQTTPENLHRDIGSYTLDPATRYPNLNRLAVTVHQVKHMINTDDLTLLEQIFMDTTSASTGQDHQQLPRRKRRTGGGELMSDVLLRWIKNQLEEFDFTEQLENVKQIFTNGKPLCALINRFRPDLFPLANLDFFTVHDLNQRAFEIIQNEFGIVPVMSAAESMTLDEVPIQKWLTYLEKICDVFRGEIPHVHHEKLDFAELKVKQTNNRVPDFSQLLKFNSRKVKSPSGELEAINAKVVADDDRGRRIRKLNNENSPAAPVDIPSRRAKKRRSHEKFGNMEERQKRIEEIESNRQERQNKRRLHRAQQTQNFYKSLHMLQANTLLRESDSSSPFEDYSIFMYRQSAPEFGDRVKELERKLLYPDRDRGIQSALPRNAAGEPDYHFNDRIKSMEHKITAKNAIIVEKKPKDLLRAIGKIESNDWNIREIEKKIEQSKKTEVGKSREKVPKWSKEQFLQRQTKMSRPLDQQDNPSDEKFKEIDQTIKSLDKQLKDGKLLERGERGKNKVASIAGAFVKKDEPIEKLSSDDNKIAVPVGINPLQGSNSKSGLVFGTQNASECCHLCKQRVYLMEKINAEGLILHRSCLKCYHCHTSLRLGGYAFDRDDPIGHFYCTQHFRLPAKAQRPAQSKRNHHYHHHQQHHQQQPPQPHHHRISSRNKMETDAIASSQLIAQEKQQDTQQKQLIQDKILQTPPKIIDSVDLAHDQREGQTPERIEFENVNAMSDGEPSLENIIDENEWTDRNFGTGTESESDLSSSDDSDSDSDSEEYEEAMGSPLGAQTLQLATDWIGKQRYSSANQFSDDDDEDEFYDTSDDDGADSQTEGEELEKARAIRMKEVKLKPLPYLPTDTETEVQSDSDSSSPVVELNSATEISTDSEFEHDPIIRETPQIFIDDSHLKKPTRVQIKQCVIENGGIRRPSPTKHQNNHHPHHHQNHHLTSHLPQAPPLPQIEFQPLFQVDPSVLPASRIPLKNPRPGDYMLNKTASTEGIASKKSLELKKRYLLGGDQTSTTSTGLMKSDSTSVLDSKFKNFHSNISQCQKMLSNIGGGGGGGGGSGSGSTVPSPTPPAAILATTLLISPIMSMSVDEKTLTTKESPSQMKKSTSSSSTIAASPALASEGVPSAVPLIIASSLEEIKSQENGKIVNILNELNNKSDKIKTSSSPPVGSIKVFETINTTLIENKIKAAQSLPKSPSSSPPSPIIYKTIDLVTPEKVSTPKSILSSSPPSVPNIIDIANIKISDKNVRKNQEFIENLRNDEEQAEENDDIEVIDLTGNSPSPPVFPKVSPQLHPQKEQTMAERSKTTIDSMLHNQSELKRTKNSNDDVLNNQQHLPPRSPVHETTITVPNIPWKTGAVKDVESDSLSSASTSSASSSTSSSTTSTASSNTSSVEDIPHCVLESTTSPDTLPPGNNTGSAAVNCVPRLEIRDTAGELMQIDSLMIIDGKYIGDPEDLKIMKMPDCKKATATKSTGIISEKICDIMEEKKIVVVSAQSQPQPQPTPAPALSHSYKQYKYQSSSSSLMNQRNQQQQISAQPRPDLKFDTKNENKIDSLKNLPLIVDKSSLIPLKLQSTIDNLSDTDKTPTAQIPPILPPTGPTALKTPQTPTTPLISPQNHHSDSETELTTNPVLTETELSDWAADDAISENFVDIEFVVNSNKGTIRRNKKSRKKQKQQPQQQIITSAASALAAPLVKDFDDIEFMDTGSEDSCLETYSATNKAMLKNRGYVQFIDNQHHQNHHETIVNSVLSINTTAINNSIGGGIGTNQIDNHLYSYKSDAGYGSSPKDSIEKMYPTNNGGISGGTGNNSMGLDLLEAINKEIPGVDYIEQGACILGNNEIDLKTPMNEVPPMFQIKYGGQNTEQPESLLDIEEDSLIILSNKVSGGSLSYRGGGGGVGEGGGEEDGSGGGLASGHGGNNTTTEDSDALTIVTSPIDSTPNLVASSSQGGSGNGGACGIGNKNKSSSSILSSDVILAGSNIVGQTAPVAVLSETPIKQQRKDSEECTYEEYVRKLQQKISQISNARDSIDIRKTKRKSSKGDVSVDLIFDQQFSNNDVLVGEQSSALAPAPQTSQQQHSVIDINKSLSIFVNKQEPSSSPCSPLVMPSSSSCSTKQQLIMPITTLTAPQTLTERIDKITKERTKQKDLIHDLVMDKLQSKKQLNAEKRLNRSRNRNNVFSPSSSAISTTTNNASAGIGSILPGLVTSHSCANVPHHHHHHHSQLPTLTDDQTEYFKSTNKNDQYLQSTLSSRPLSSSGSGGATTSPQKLMKAQSFCVYTSKQLQQQQQQQQLPLEEINGFSTPVPPPRRKYGEPVPSSSVQPPLSAQPTTDCQTDKLRQDARARARLKSNQDLGLSPEEKMQLLRRRLNLDSLTPLNQMTPQISTASALTPLDTPEAIKAAINKSDDMKVRERKMITSKSVNDIASVSSSPVHNGSGAGGGAASADANTIITSSGSGIIGSNNKIAQKTTDNLGIKKQHSDFTSDPNLADASPTKRRSHHNHKDPERRRSIIKAVSDFFYKKKDTSPSPAAAASTATATTFTSIDGGCRNNNKDKSSSDSVFGRFRISPKNKSKDQSPTTNNYERSKSEDYLKINDTTKSIMITQPTTRTTTTTNSMASSHQRLSDEVVPPPIPPLPTNYQRSDDESYSANENREQKKIRAHTKASRQAELKRLRIAQEIQREQEEIEVKLKDLEARGVLIEKALRGEGQNLEEMDPTTNNSSIGANDDKLLKELLEIWRNITQLKKRDDELGIRQQELQLEHRHAQLKDQLNTRLSCSRLDKSSSDVAAEGAILNEMLEIVAKRAALRTFDGTTDQQQQQHNIPKQQSSSSSSINQHHLYQHHHHHHHQQHQSQQHHQPQQQQQHHQQQHHHQSHQHQHKSSSGSGGGSRNPVADKYDESDI